MSDRLPPNSPEAERGVLGCILLDPEGALSDCAEGGVSDRWFYDLRHRIIFQVVTALEAQGVGIDVLLVRNALLKRGDLEKIGGDVYLSSLPDAVPSAANLPHYLGILEDAYIRREIVAACTEAVGSIYATGRDGKDAAEASTVLVNLEKNVARLEEGRSGAAEQSIKSLIGDTMLTLEQRYHRGSAQVVGLTTGLEYLDKLLCGIGGENGNMIVIAGRPGTGKTSWAIDLALHVALDYQWYTPQLDKEGHQLKDGDKLLWTEHRGVPVGIFSLEMSTYSIVHKMLFQRARADIQRWRTGFAPDEDKPRLRQAAEEIVRAQVWIDDTPRCTIGELRAKARRWIRQYGIKLFIVDYIQLMRADNRRFRDDRVQELAEISGDIQSLGKHLGVPFVVLAQMNRDYEKDQSRQPRLSDLKDCGAIEQDADVVAFLYEPRHKEKQDEAHQKAMEAIFGTDWSKYPRRINMLIAKNRFGPIGNAQLLFEHACTHFVDYGRWMKGHGQRVAAKGERKPDLSMPTTEELLE